MRTAILITAVILAGCKSPLPRYYLPRSPDPELRAVMDAARPGSKGVAGALFYYSREDALHPVKAE